MVGWNIRPKQLVAQLLQKDKCFIYVIVMSLIVVH
jgi:hypothetical protein